MTEFPTSFFGVASFAAGAAFALAAVFFVSLGADAFGAGASAMCSAASFFFAADAVRFFCSRAFPAVSAFTFALFFAVFSSVAFFFATFSSVFFSLFLRAAFCSFSVGGGYTKNSLYALRKSSLACFVPIPIMYDGSSAFSDSAIRTKSESVVMIKYLRTPS